jgi:hypothetical protein
MAGDVKNTVREEEVVEAMEAEMTMTVQVVEEEEEEEEDTAGAQMTVATTRPPTVAVETMEATITISLRNLTKTLAVTEGSKAGAMAEGNNQQAPPMAEEDTAARTTSLGQPSTPIRKLVILAIPISSLLPSDFSRARSRSLKKKTSTRTMQCNSTRSFMGTDRVANIKQIRITLVLPPLCKH